MLPAFGTPIAGYCIISRVMSERYNSEVKSAGIFQLPPFASVDRQQLPAEKPILWML